jgi:hypothetical protein
MLMDATLQIVPCGTNSGESERRCKCGGILRTKSRYCRACRRIKHRAWYQRKDRTIAKLREIVDHLTATNPDTRDKFELRFPNRHVLVVAEPGDRFGNGSGYVVAFLPAETVSVLLDGSGRRVDHVPLDRLRKNPDYQT